MKNYIGHSLPKIQNQDAAFLAVRRSEGLFCRDIYPKEILQGATLPCAWPKKKTLALRENFLGEMLNFTGNVVGEKCWKRAITLRAYFCQIILAREFGVISEVERTNSVLCVHELEKQTNKQKHVPTTFLVHAEILSFVRPTEC